MPLPVSCPGPVLRLFGSGEGSGPVHLSPCLALGRLPPGESACVSGAVRCLGGVCREGGRPVCHTPRGRVGSGLVWGSGGLEGGGSLVCPSASLAGGTRRAPLGSLSRLRVQRPYCLGLCPCPPARARPGRGAVGRPGVQAGRWPPRQAGPGPRAVRAAACRGHWGRGWVTVLRRAARGPGSVSGAALGLWLRSSRGGGGAAMSPGLWGGYRARAARRRGPLRFPPGGPPGRSSALRGLGWASTSLPAPHRLPGPVLCCAARPVAGGVGVPAAVLEGLGPGFVTRRSGGAPTMVGFPCVSGRGNRCGLSSAGPRRGGRSPLCPWPCERLGGVCSRVALGAPRRDVPSCWLPGAVELRAAWYPRAPGAPRGVSSWRVSLCRTTRPRATRRALVEAVTLVRTPYSLTRGCHGLLRSGLVEASLLPHALACRRPGGGGGALGVSARRGSTPRRWPVPPLTARRTGLGPLGAGSLPWPSPTVPSATRVAAFTLCGAVGRGGGGHGKVARRVSPVLGCLGRPGVRGRGGCQPWSAVSVQWSAGQKGSIAACARSLRAAGVRLTGGTPSRVPAASVAPMIRGHAFPLHVLLRGRLGGGCPAPGGHYLRGGAPRAIGLHPPTPVFAIRGLELGLLGVGPDSRQIAASPPGRRRHRPWAPPPSAPSLAWGLEMRRRPVSWAIAPVAEGCAQSPGQPDIGLRVREAEHCRPLQESRPPRLLVGPSCPNHGPEDSFVGTFRSPPSLQRSTASKGRFLNPLVVPEVAQLSHPYTSSISGRASPHRASGTVLQSVTQSLALGGARPSPLPPKTARGSCATHAGSALDPRAARAAAIRAAGAESCGASPCRRGSGWQGRWGGWGGIRAPISGTIL